MNAFSYFELPVESNQFLRGALHSTCTENAPCFIFCHGFSSQRMGPAYLFVKLSRILADAGFSSIRFDFRGSGESDGFFYDMNISTMKKDLSTVLMWIKQYRNPTKFFLIGHSFGGIIVTLCSKDADGVVLISPVANLQELLQSQNKMIQAGPNNNGFYEFGPHEMKNSFTEYMQIDPVKILCESFKGPLLLIHGDADKSISKNESERYFSEARKSGINPQYHILKDADHNYSRVADIKLLCDIVTDWAKEQNCE